MVCACFGSSVFAYCSRGVYPFHTLTVPEILHRWLFLTIKTRIAVSTDAQNTLPIVAHSSELILGPSHRAGTGEPASAFLIYVRKL
jgi:hypothetical protein